MTIVGVEHCDQDLCLTGEYAGASSGENILGWSSGIKICVELARMINCTRTLPLLFTMRSAFYFRVVFFRRNSDLVTTLSSSPDPKYPAGGRNF